MTHVQVPLSEPQEGSFLGGGKLKLYYQQWHANLPVPRAVLVYIRGGNDPTILAVDALRYLVSHGYAVYTFNRREQERSPGQHGYIEEWGKLREDIRNLLEIVAGQQENRPLFLVGSGTGAPLVQAYALHGAEGLNGVLIIDPQAEQQRSRSLILNVFWLLSQIWPRRTSCAALPLPSASTGPREMGAPAPDALPAEEEEQGRESLKPSSDQEADVRIGDRVVPVLFLHSRTPAGAAVASQSPSRQEGARHRMTGAVNQAPQVSRMVLEMEAWIEQHR